VRLVFCVFCVLCILHSGVHCKISTSTASVTTHSDAQSCEVELIQSDRIPKPLQFSIDIDLPTTSFLTLRREMLSDQSDFWLNTVMTEALQYSKYVFLLKRAFQSAFLHHFAHQYSEIVMG
jgi:hypothetical protein